MHASRTGAPSGVDRGGRVRNTWLTCPTVGDNPGKPGLIPHTLRPRDRLEERSDPLMEGAAAD